MPTPSAFEIQLTVSLDRKKLSAYTSYIAFHCSSVLSCNIGDRICRFKRVVYLSP